MSFKAGIKIEGKSYTHFVRAWRPTWRGRWLDRWAWLDRWYQVTRWWRPRYVTTAVNVERGVVTMDVEFWSWRRWRWEPRA